MAITLTKLGIAVPGALLLAGLAVAFGWGAAITWALLLLGLLAPVIEDLFLDHRLGPFQLLVFAASGVLLLALWGLALAPMVGVTS